MRDEPHPPENESWWRLRALEEVSDDAIIGTDLQGIICSWSPGAELLYGFQRDEAVGRSIFLIVPEDLQNEARYLLDDLDDATAVACHETRRCTRGGAEIEVEERVRAVVDPGRGVAGALIVHRDLTEQRWTTATLDGTLDRLDAALRQAQAAEERSRGFLADAAHQLRSPLASIRVCTETLLQGVEEPEAERLLNDLVRQTARAGRLVAKLLRVARLDEGEELAPQACDLVELCGEEVDRVWHLAPGLNFVLRADALPDDGFKLDPGVIREIMTNLLENAVRYALSQVEVTVTATAGLVELRVADDGPGLPADDADRAFERFVTLDEKGGFGLGLPIARELARAHGGDVTYEAGGFVARVSVVDAVS